MKLKALWFVSFVAGCGLVQVNGKPVGGTSSSPSSSSSSSSNSESPTETKASAPSTTASSSSSSSSEPAPSNTAANAPGKKLTDFAEPDDNSKRQSWTPLQQFLFIVHKAKQPYRAMLVADELGDKLSHAGRIGLIAKCWDHSTEDAKSAAAWAVCGAEVEAFNADALRKELQREGMSGEATKEFLAWSAGVIEKAKKYGAAVTAAAKDDPGIAAVVATGKTAREEWKSFASANAEQVALLATLEDNVRQDKNGLAGDCMAKTLPAMEKVVRATKWRENDTSMMPNYFYVNLVPKTVEAHVATAAWASCVALVNEAGKTLYAAAYATEYEDTGRRFKRWLRRGPRTLTVAKLFDGDVKPKFASRTLDMRALAPSGDTQLGSMGMGAPTDAKIAKVVKNGDETTIKFDDKRIGCTDWVDTNKFSGWTTAGDPTYERKCTRRGVIEDPKSDVVTPTAFTNGLAPGLQVTVEYNFPIVAQKGEKFVAALGIKL